MANPTEMSSAKKRQAREQVQLSEWIYEQLSTDYWINVKVFLTDDIRATLNACEDMPIQRGAIRQVATARVRYQIITRFHNKVSCSDAILKRAAALCAKKLCDEVWR